MRYLAIGLTVLLVITGCVKSRKSALLLERYSRGTLAEVPTVGGPVAWSLEPLEQKQAQRGVEITVRYASPEYLHTFFSNRRVFGSFAGQNPYFPEHLVFYLTIANRGEGRIRLSPSEFVLVDDRGNQLSPLNVDYVTAYAEYRAPMATATRGLLEGARPGYFGFSLPLGKMIATKPQGRFALIQQSAVQSGNLYPGVVHDGLIGFWNPSREAKTIRLLLANIKTDFDANDWPQTSLEFPFTFNAVTPDH